MDEKRVDPLRQHILEAVDCLRQRKCRPDRESIAHYVLRKFGSTMNEIFAELENIVDENGLIKVEYKGTTSYRSPSSFDTKNSPLLTKHSKILNSSKTTRYIITGINELLVKDPNYAKEGVPLDELKATLVSFDEVRFGEENMDIVLEREKNYGNIQIAKSTILTNSLRVFPKDIPVPADMLKISLSAELLPTVKEEKKPRKPRKSNVASDTSEAAGTSPAAAKKGGRAVKVKKEVVVKTEAEDPVTVFAVKSDPPPPSETDDSEGAEGSTPKKIPRLTSGRKTVAEKVSDAVGKKTVGVTEFESKSAQMIKLAAAVVTKQVEELKPKGPTLVLAESVKGKGTNGEATHEADSSETSVEETTTVTTTGKKKRGRPTATDLDVSSKDESLNDTKEEEEEVDHEKVSPSSDQGLTRSKRDKRKKQVFDPSDLPKTYSNYSNSAKSTRKSRATRSPSFEEPPAKKIVVSARTSRATQRKSLVVVEPEEKEKRVSRSKSKKADEEIKNTNSETVTLENSDNHENNETTDETELMDTGDTNTEKETETTDTDMHNDKEETDKNNVIVEKEEISTAPDSTIEKRCEYCRQNKNKHIPNDDEELLTCASCLANIHPTCMQYSTELTLRIKEFEAREGSEKIPWKCFDCKTCGICQERLFSSEPPKKSSASKTELTSGKVEISNKLQYNLCEHCDVGFHVKCTNEEKNPKPGTWICEGCKATQELSKKNVPVQVKTEKPKPKKKTRLAARKKKTAAATITTDRSLRPSKVKSEPQESPSSVVVKQEVEKEKVLDESISVKDSNSQPGESTEEDKDTLDITGWTPSDVEAFFIEKGLKDEAAILREQDVDGYSLLLLRREDIIDGLRLRLGPALKVNRLIYELQAKAPVKAKWSNSETAEREPADTSQR